MAIDDNTSYELFGYQVKELATKINSKAEAASLAPVATSGLYSDIIGAPTVPTVYNGALIIKQNGKTLGTFTANSSDDKTVNIQAITAGEVGVITTNMIANGAVTAEKVNWDTFRTGTPQLLGWSVSSGTFTAPSLGLVIVQAASAANATCSLAINGKTVERVQGGASAFTWAPMTILVSKGDVVNGTTSDNGGNAQFVPSGCSFIPLVS